MTDAKRETRWSFSTGERGRNRVRAFEHPKTGTLFLEFSEPTRSGGKPQVKRVALGHRNQERAKAQAEELAAAIRKGEPPRREHATLGMLFDNYLKEVTSQYTTSKHDHDHRAAALFLRAFGAEREARTLSRREWDRFIKERRSGRLAPKPKKKARRRAVAKRGKRQAVQQPPHVRTPRKPRPVRNTIIARDLEFLRAVLNWATMVSDGKGGVLLERNPLKGFPLPKEEAPVRVRVDDAVYEKLLAVAPDIDPRFALALVLARETGHRIGGILALRWSDVDTVQKIVRWRAENDKIGYEHTTPLTDAAVAALERERSRQKAIGDAWIFPAPKDATKPCRTDVMVKWWGWAERRAKLEPVKRRGWHSLRRAFATDLKHVPLKDLCELGGWKEPTTVLTCYIQPDQDTMRKALEERRPIAAGGVR